MHKLLLYFSILAFTLSCKVKEPVPNRPPADFKVRVTLDKDGKTVTLSWDEAIDPDGDAVKYSVYLGDTLIKKITETFFKVSSLDYDFKKDGEIIAFDTKGLKTSSSFVVETAQNKQPNNFTVIPTLGNDGKTITLKWTQAIDPNGDNVNYNVVLGKDTLAKGLIDTIFVINNLDYEYVGSGSIVATDFKGLATKASFQFRTGENPFISIPDANFEVFLVEKGIDKDGKVNGQMAKENAIGIKSIQINFNKKIENLNGIEAFLDLENLTVFGGKGEDIGSLNYLDLSKNIKLKYLDCTGNKLINLDLSKNVNLADLSCSYNTFTNLNLRENSNLIRLNCGFNNLVNLDISNNKKLIYLQCDNNNLSNLDVSKNVDLINLYFDHNNVSNFNVNNNVKLEWLVCSNNKILNLNLLNIAGLKYLFCNNNKLTFLDVSKNLVLDILNCLDNNISIICVSEMSITKAKSNWRKDPLAEYKICN